MNRLKNYLLSLVWLLFFFVGVPKSHAETSVSGTVITSDGKVVASGIVALERGELHNNVFETGGVIGDDGRFRIPLPSGGHWGLHVYSEGYLYFPLQIMIRENQNNEVPVVLPLDSNTKDDPTLSNIRFEKRDLGQFRIRVTVQDRNQNLGPQMLAIDGDNYRSYRLVPVGGDLSDPKADFPEGEYVSPVIKGDLNTLDKTRWFFVAADHQCSNGVIYNGVNNSIFAEPRPNPEPLRCDIPGIWKSNFDKTYRFTGLGSYRFAGEQFEGQITIKDIYRKGDLVHFSFIFENQEGEANLSLVCWNKAVELRGPFSFPSSGRKGTWMFTKLKNERLVPSGETLFENNCAVCHFTDSRSQKVGPGLLGLFKGHHLPSGKPTNEANVIEQIKEGGGGMPPFSHFNDEELQPLIDYLKSL